MDEAAGETRPKIVWPDSVKETDFVLPEWYGASTPKEPGFEAVFSVACLLAIAFMVRRRQK